MRTLLRYLVVSVAFTFSTTYAGSLPTAKKAAEMANARVKAGAQYQVIRIEGGHTDTDLRPRQWDVTVYDPVRGNHAVTIRVKDGVIVSERGAVRIVDDAHWAHFDRNFTGYDPSEIIKLARWKVDSSDVIAKMLALPDLANVQLVDVKLILRKLSDGDVPPVWRARLKARSKAQPEREQWIGYADLSADTGELIRNETQPQRLLK